MSIVKKIMHCGQSYGLQCGFEAYEVLGIQTNLGQSGSQPYPEGAEFAIVSIGGTSCSTYACCGAGGAFIIAKGDTNTKYMCHSRVKNDSIGVCYNGMGGTTANIARYGRRIIGGEVPMGRVQLLVVGGGGGGGGADSDSAGCCSGGGGGAGGYILCNELYITDNTCPILVGAGGSAGGDARGCNGGSSKFGIYVSYGGGSGALGGPYYGLQSGCPGGSGGGGAGYSNNGAGVCGQGHNGGGGGGGGAGTAGNRTGGDGLCNCFFGQCLWFAAGGGASNDPRTSGSVAYCGGNGGGGHGCSSAIGGNATTYGSGGGAGGNKSYGCSYGGGCGCQGIVGIKYKTDGSDGIAEAVGGTIYCCNGYTIHRFDTVGSYSFVPVLNGCITNCNI